MRLHEDFRPRLRDHTRPLVWYLGAALAWGNLAAPSLLGWSGPRLVLSDTGLFLGALVLGVAPYVLLRGRETRAVGLFRASLLTLLVYLAAFATGPLTRLSRTLVLTVTPALCGLAIALGVCALDRLALRTREARGRALFRAVRGGGRRVPGWLALDDEVLLFHPILPGLRSARWPLASLRAVAVRGRRRETLLYGRLRLELDLAHGLVELRGLGAPAVAEVLRRELAARGLPLARPTPVVRRGAELEAAYGLRCEVVGRYAVQAFHSKKGTLIARMPVVELDDARVVMLGSIWKPQERALPEGLEQGERVLASGRLWAAPPGSVQNIEVACISPVEDAAPME